MGRDGGSRLAEKRRAQDSRRSEAPGRRLTCTDCSTVFSCVLMWISGAAGASYGDETPVKSVRVDPARTPAFK